MLTAILLVCLPTKIINTSGFRWNEADDLVLARARYVCGNDPIYSDTPCLGMLHKKEERGFVALCTYKRDLYQQ